MGRDAGTEEEARVSEPALRNIVRTIRELRKTERVDFGSVVEVPEELFAAAEVELHARPERLGDGWNGDGLWINESIAKAGIPNLLVSSCWIVPDGQADEARRAIAAGG